MAVGASVPSTGADERLREQAIAGGFDPDRLVRAFHVLQGAVDGGSIPGAVATVGRLGEPAAGPVAYGYRAVLPDRETMETSTLFDMASVTKVMATAPVAMALVERGQLRLGAAVVQYLPEFGSGPSADEKRKVRIFHLLTHTSGLPPWRALYEGAAGAHTRPGECRPVMLDRLIHTDLEAPPGERVAYSCLGFILLGQILENLTGAALGELARKLLFEPMQMAGTTFKPAPADASRCAATEYCALRRRIIRGEVHDENAYFWGGDAGNAGLFSTAEDAAAFARMMLQKGLARPGARILSEAAVTEMTANHTPSLNEPRGLGWAVRDRSLDSSAGDLMSPRAFGHTGFTGTSIWMDPERGLYCVLLTNRVHPSRQNEAHVPLRPAFHNAVVAALATP